MMRDIHKLEIIGQINYDKYNISYTGHTCDKHEHLIINHNYFKESQCDSNFLRKPTKFIINDRLIIKKDDYTLELWNLTDKNLIQNKKYPFYIYNMYVEDTGDILLRSYEKSDNYNYYIDNIENWKHQNITKPIKINPKTVYKNYSCKISENMKISKINEKTYMCVLLWSNEIIKFNYNIETKFDKSSVYIKQTPNDSTDLMIICITSKYIIVSYTDEIGDEGMAVYTINLDIICVNYRDDFILVNNNKFYYWYEDIHDSEIEEYLNENNQYIFNIAQNELVGNKFSDETIIDKILCTSTQCIIGHHNNSIYYVCIQDNHHCIVIYSTCCKTKRIIIHSEIDDTVLGVIGNDKYIIAIKKDKIICFK